MYAQARERTFTLTFTFVVYHSIKSIDHEINEYINTFLHRRVWMCASFFKNKKKRYEKALVM